jgi:hypothetical protein
MANKKPKMLDPGAAQQLVDDLLSSTKSVREVIANRKAMDNQPEDDTPPEGLVTEDIFYQRRAFIEALAADLSRADKWQNIKSYKLVFTIGEVFECIVDGKAYPQALQDTTDVYTYLRKRITGEA